jgi:hypothetical protein
MKLRHAQSSRSKALACSCSAQTDHTSAERGHCRRTLTAWRGDPCRADSGGRVSNSIGRGLKTPQPNIARLEKDGSIPSAKYPATHS